MSLVFAKDHPFGMEGHKLFFVVMLEAATAALPSFAG
jgi:hypothetical protein